MASRRQRAHRLLRVALVAAALLAMASPAARAAPELTHYVNPFNGTDAGAADFGTGGGAGNTYPGATLPFGMLNWSPDSTPSLVNSPGGYSYPDTELRGFSLTHLSGAGCPVYQDIPILPTTTPITGSPVAPASTEWQPQFVPSFSHADEDAEPGYYRVRLDPGTPDAIESKLTVTTRSGLGHFEFPGTDRATMLINPGGSGFANSAAQVDIDPTGREVTGFADGGQFCVNRNTYRVYFAARFDRAFDEFGTWRKQLLQPGSTSSSDTAPVALNYEPNPYGPESLPGNPSSTAQAGAYLTFDARENQTVRVKVAISYVSADAARRNLDAENRDWDFDAMRIAARSTWNRLLNRARVSGGSLPRLRTYYTALYHALLAPRTFSDADGTYMGMDGQPHSQRDRTQYADFSGWDIYRTQIPLLALISPARTGDMLQSLVNDARESGCLPKWPVANDQTNVMVGDPADLIISGADAFGVRGYDRAAAIDAMVRGATAPCQDTGPSPYVQRQGLAEYLQLGYIPMESNSPLGNATTVFNPAGVWGAAATTLEYTAADFAISRLAQRLGDDARARTFLRRSGNWRKLFNPATGYIQQRSATGAFSPNYDPASDDGFVEGSGGQYTWAVPYDVAGLVEAMGGRAAAAERLDEFFGELNAGPKADRAYLGNEPTLGTPWIYAWLGEPYKTQRIVREAQLTLYDSSPTGSPGNDDLGTMSAWYVLSSLGLYPATPGTDVLTLSSPLFPRARLRLAGGVLRIKARRASDATAYVQRVSLRGACVNRPWVRARRLMRGGRLDFRLAAEPNTRWGASRAAAPPSFSATGKPATRRRPCRKASGPTRRHGELEPRFTG
jgi:predicted alpha-1,2-mannosidase